MHEVPLWQSVVGWVGDHHHSPQISDMFFHFGDGYLLSAFSSVFGDVVFRLLADFLHFFGEFFAGGDSHSITSLIRIDSKGKTSSSPGKKGVNSYLWSGLGSTSTHFFWSGGNCSLKLGLWSGGGGLKTYIAGARVSGMVRPLMASGLRGPRG